MIQRDIPMCKIFQLKEYKMNKKQALKQWLLMGTKKAEVSMGAQALTPK